MAILSFYAGANGGGSADKFKVVNVPDLYALSTEDEEISIDAFIQQVGITMDDFLALFDLHTIAVTDDSGYMVYKSSGYRVDNEGNATFGNIAGLNYVGYVLEIYFDLGPNIVMARFSAL